MTPVVGCVVELVAWWTNLTLNGCYYIFPERRNLRKL